MADELNRPEIKNFIEAFVEEDIGPGGQYEGMQVHTRFPPDLTREDYFHSRELAGELLSGVYEHGFEDSENIPRRFRAEAVLLRQRRSEKSAV